MAESGLSKSWHGAPVWVWAAGGGLVLVGAYRVWKARKGAASTTPAGSGMLDPNASYGPPAGGGSYGGGGSGGGSSGSGGSAGAAGTPTGSGLPAGGLLSGTWNGQTTGDTFTVGDTPGALYSRNGQDFTGYWVGNTKYAWENGPLRQQQLSDNAATFSDERNIARGYGVPVPADAGIAMGAYNGQRYIDVAPGGWAHPTGKPVRYPVG